MKSVKTLFHLVPFFPKQKFLKKHWWHRLAEVVVAVLNLVILIPSLLAFLFVVGVFFLFLVVPKKQVYEITNSYNIGSYYSSNRKFVEKEELVYKTRKLFPFYERVKDEDLTKIVILMFTPTDEIEKTKDEWNWNTPSNIDRDELVEALENKGLLFDSLEEDVFNKRYLEDYLRTDLQEVFYTSLIGLLFAFLIPLFIVGVYSTLLYIFIGDLNKKEKL